MLRDFEAYWAAGAAWNAGVDPYGRGIWNQERRIAGVDARRDEVLPFVGPPSALIGWSLFARLPYPAAARLWAALLALCLLGLVAAAIRCGASSFTGLTFLAGLVLAIAFAPITSDLALGQLALPAFFGATLAMVTAQRSRWLGAAAAALAMTQPNTALGLLSPLGRNRTKQAIALGAVATCALAVFAGGWSWPLRYARAIAAHHAAERFSAIQVSPTSIVYGFGAPPHVADIVGLLVALITVAAGVALAIAVRDRFARFAAFSALAPFVAGFFHEHDLLTAYVGALWCALRTRATTRVIALAGTLLIAVDWLGLAQRPTGIAQSALLAFAALGAFVALGDERDLWTACVSAPVFGVLFSGAAWMAVRNPIAVWPNPLVAFHAAAGASIAQIWLAEQRASGLLVASPAWALLRSLSLLGCGLLAYAIYRHSTSDRTA